MLDSFRHAKSVLGYIFFGAIAVVFVLSFGPGSIGRRSGAPAGAVYAAVVNGQIIGEGDFQLAYANLYRQMKQQMGESYDASRARQDNLKARALQQLIEVELLAQAATQHGIRVSDAELRDTILRDPSFQDPSGQFDVKGYERYLQYQLGMSPAKYEERVRRRLLAAKMFELLLTSSMVADDEARARFLAQNEKAKIGYVSFSPAMFRDSAAPTAAEVASFADANSEKVRAQFEQTRYLYSEPRAAWVRRILVQVPPGGDEAAAKAKADAALAELTGGADFAAVAKKYSDDVASKDKGGEVGWVAVGRSAFGRQFEDEVARLEKGQTSQVFKDRIGFHIVRVEDTRPPTQKEFDEVKLEVAKQMLGEEKAREAARQAAEGALARAKTAADLKKAFPPAAAKDETTFGPRKPEYRESEEFSPGDSSIPGLGYAPAVARAAFSLGMDKPVASAPVEELGSYFAVVLLDRTRADLEKFQAEKEKWREEVRRQKQLELYQKLVQSLFEKARIEQNQALLAYADDGQAAPAP